MTVSAFDQADAKHREQVVAVWRDWRAYLQANLAILAAEQQIGQDNPFEQRNTADDPETQARGVLAAIPADRRRLFAVVCAHRRAGLLTELDAERRTASHSNGTRPRAPDPDAVDQQLFRTLLDEAEGRGEDSLGHAPRDEQTFYGIEVDALLAAPNAAAYRIQGGLSKRGRLIGIVAVVIVGLGAVLFSLFGGRPSTSTPRAQAAARANDVALTPWSISGVELDMEGKTLALSVAVQGEDGAWPSSGAGIVSQALTPLTLCLPPDRLAQVASLRVLGANRAPDRVYRLNEGATTDDQRTMGDLLVVPCQGKAASRSGTLVSTAAPPVYAIGTPVSIGGNTLWLQQLGAEGVDDDATLPPDQARIVATFTASKNVDWAELSPVLLTAFGTVVNVGETRTLSDMVELRYLVPTFSASMDAVIQVIPSGTTRAVAYRGRVTPPEARADRLRRVVQVDALAAVQSTEALTISLTVRSTDTRPMTLTHNDITLTTRDNTPLDVVPFSLDLSPNLPATLEVQTVAPPVGDRWNMGIGSARYALAVPERR